jgi:hypothetical protein
MIAGRLEPIGSVRSCGLVSAWLAGLFVTLPGTTRLQQRCADQDTKGCARGEKAMDSIIYLVGLVVVIMFILSFLGLR